MTEVDEELFPDSFEDVKTDTWAPLPATSVLNLHVNRIVRPGDVDASALIFGVSTTYGRFTQKETTPIEEWTRWLTDGKGNSNGAGLVLTLFETTDEEISHALECLTAIGINATVVASNPSLDMAGRYVDLVQTIWNHPSRDQRKYFALIDDDTFFPNIADLLETLSAYDPKKRYYIGTITERADFLLNNHAAMAYGGGGVFFTGAMASTIASLPCLEKKGDGSYVLGGDQGDRLLYNCIHTKTEVALSYLPCLKQEDQFGDPSGLYESGRKLLSMHHFKSWHHSQPAKMHTVASACGEDCVLQRFQFKDNFIVSNGYSVAQYPKGINFDIDQVEGTFELPNENEFQDVMMMYVYGELRKDLNKTGRKLGWELIDARVEGDGRVSQVYLKRHMDQRWIAEGEENPALDSVVVLTWIP